MRNFSIYFSLAFLIIILSACREQPVKNSKNNTTSIPLKYAKRFKISKFENNTIIELLGNKKDSIITATFVLYKNTKPNYADNAYYIKTPVKTIASMSSIYTAMLQKLGVISSIIAIDNVDYYNNPVIIQSVSEKKICELAKGPKIDVEQTIALNPKLIFTFGMGNPKVDMDAKIIDAGIPVAISLDHLEETPLARAEWIKFFAYFFNKEQLADSLFTATENKYQQLKSLTNNLTNKPRVLTEIKYGDTWFVPAGNSYMAHLIADAGGNYFFSKDKNTGSTPLTFEDVYQQAEACDIWINLYNINSKKELLSYDTRYELFAAFKNNKLYNNNKVQNNKGYSNYWETGIINPDDILADLLFIFSPKLLPQHQLMYYKHIQ